MNLCFVSACKVNFWTCSLKCSDANRSNRPFFHLCKQWNAIFFIRNDNSWTFQVNTVFPLCLKRSAVAPVSLNLSLLVPQSPRHMLKFIFTSFVKLILSLVITKQNYIWNKWKIQTFWQCPLTFWTNCTGRWTSACSIFTDTPSHNSLRHNGHTIPTGAASISY